MGFNKGQGRSLNCLIVLMIMSGPVLSVASGEAFQITNQTMDSGGGRMASDTAVLTGTIGQPDASREPASGGKFVITGGFWGPVAEISVDDLVFSDDFEDSQLN